MTTKEEMIQEQLINRGIQDTRVLSAMREVERINFVPESLVDLAYQDRPLPIGRNQTISQPYIVAYMAQELQLKPNQRVLEIGTGCGYNAAVLSKLAKEVYSIEIIDWLAKQAKHNLGYGTYENLHTMHGDGYEGWPEHAPFDAIILTAAPTQIPRPLKKQLAVNGYLLAPVGAGHQELVLLKKTAEDSFEQESLLPVSFVPMTGKAKAQN